MFLNLNMFSFFCIFEKEGIKAGLQKNRKLSHIISRKEWRIIYGK